MSLAQHDLEQIGEYVQANLPRWMPQPTVHDINLHERIVRVEEGLKAQLELTRQILDQMDKRFEQVDKRFEQVDKRFEQVDKRFDMILHQMDKRFEQVDKRFEQSDRRFDELTRRIDRFMVWSFSTTVATGGIIVAALKLWPTG